MLHLILVEDDPEVLRALQRQLRGHCDFVTCRTAESAWELLRNPYWADWTSAVVTDHDLPGMNGAELLERVYRRWPSKARILCSSEDQPLVNSHCQAFFKKPVSGERLLAEIDKLRRVGQ